MSRTNNCPDSFSADLRAEENRQAEWDRKLANSPVCSCCGSPVITYGSYLEYEDIVLCEECISKFTLSTLE